MISTVETRATSLAPAQQMLRAATPSIVEIGLVGFALLVAAFGVSEGAGVPSYINFATPALLVFALVTGVVLMVAQDNAAVWTPLFWWRLSMIAYSGLGSLTPFLASQETLDYVNAFFLTYPADIAKYNAVACLFSFTMVLMARLTPGLLAIRGRWLTAVTTRDRCALNQFQAGIAAILIGLPIKMVITIIPFVTGRVLTISGAISTLESTMSIGYALLIAHFVDKKSNWVWLVVLIVAIDATIGVMNFNKSAAIFPIMMALLGYLYQRPSLKRALISAGVILAVFSAILPITNYGRYVDWSNGGIRYAQIGRSVDILNEYFTKGAEAAPERNVQDGWARITYFPAGSFAISQYDHGVPGDSLEYLGTVLIPRVIYPDKPIITNIAGEFNRQATGNDGSASSPGIPAEGYWNYGWTGTIIMASVMAIAFSLWTLYSLSVIQAGAWHLLLVVLLGIRNGIRIDGLFVIDFVPMLAGGIILHWILTVINTVVSRRQARLAVAPRRYA